MRGAVPDDVPDQPQTEVLHGTGGFARDGTPMDGPYTQHWWGIPKECAAYHVYSHPHHGTDDPVDSGHDFVADMQACEPCHSEETATLLVATAHEEIEIRLALIAHYFDPYDRLYVDPATLTPEELTEYHIAKFDYELAEADKSYGSHNPDYTRALLNETEGFFGIPPWRSLTPPDDDISGRAYGPPTGSKRVEVLP